MLKRGDKVWMQVEVDDINWETGEEVLTVLIEDGFHKAVYAEVNRANLRNLHLLEILKPVEGSH